MALFREQFLNTTDPVDLCAIQCDVNVDTAEDSKEFLRQVAQSSILSANFTNFATFFDKEKLTKIC
uniref:Uncharacterized protein n=1 Tax=Romanomermis culicivorax TaxID=13658 RepID=A0A915JSW1_ROMCU